MKDPIFKANPQMDCYFETSDGQKFFKDFDAKSHSKSLESKKIKKVLNPNFTTEVGEIEEVVAEIDKSVENLDVDFTEVKAGEATGTESLEVGTLEADTDKSTEVGQPEAKTGEATGTESLEVGTLEADTDKSTEVGQPEAKTGEATGTESLEVGTLEADKDKGTEVGQLEAKTGEATVETKTPVAPAKKTAKTAKPKTK